ncbi:MAG TPA: fumarylacetoacetate hydrolase family protein [Acidimicrobiales bacterium]|jgi:2-keto-4-pentenoate hydratase/2-oxohepta-3-ene-1,7-dioic acid hydratase in catechol pathway|nr:fumarylacetoacetate hydrolase family protein [Acidimicrobiales bacterium]
MQAVTVLLDGDRRAGTLTGDEVLVDKERTLDEVIEAGVDLHRSATLRLPRAAVTLDAPLRPPVVLCTGQNYRDHLAEKAPVTVREPEFFIKAGQTIAGPGDPIVLDPRVTTKLDYETELGVVIGRPCRAVAAEAALDHVWGYVVVNDLTARDRQVVPQDDGGVAFALGPSKNFDGATRLAPFLVTADEVPDPQAALALTTTVSGERRQANTTANMIFSVAEIISYLSGLLTLHPGVIIATGTPGGTGWGRDPGLGGTSRSPAGCQPGRYLAEGERLRSEIDTVGSLEALVVSP